MRFYQQCRALPVFFNANYARISSPAFAYWQSPAFFYVCDLDL